MLKPTMDDAEQGGNPSGSSCPQAANVKELITLHLP